MHNQLLNLYQCFSEIKSAWVGVTDVVVAVGYLKEGECCPLQETFCIADFSVEFL